MSEVWMAAAVAVVLGAALAYLLAQGGPRD